MEAHPKRSKDTLPLLGMGVVVLLMACVLAGYARYAPAWW